jgi:hypothetical protein
VAAFCGQTITAKETDSYFFADGKMKHSRGQFENTYYLEGNNITRTRVYDVKNKKVIPDNTVYIIQRQLTSDPQNKRFKLGNPVIRAIGQPGLDAIEILVIGDKFIQAVKSTMDYFVISRFKRID